MPKKISDEAIQRVPTLSNRISLFQSKLQIAHYAQGSVTDYCHALYKAVVYIGKLLDDFTQKDVDGYLQSMLNRKPITAEAHFFRIIPKNKSQSSAAFKQLPKEPSLGLTFSVPSFDITTLNPNCVRYVKIRFN